MAEGRGRKFTCLKYFLMSSNAFGLMIGIFLVLFGMAYKEESFPGGYKGKETSGIAGVFIFVTLIGYCGVSFISSLSILNQYSHSLSLFRILTVEFSPFLSPFSSFPLSFSLASPHRDYLVGNLCLFLLNFSLTFCPSLFLETLPF